MNTFEIMLTIIAILIAILLISAASLKKDYTIKREVVINKPKQEVFNFIRLLRNHSKFNKWTMMDPNMRMEYIGIDGTAGFVSAWDSDVKNVGKGEQEIKKVMDGERIDYNLRFIKPFEGKAGAFMTTESISDRQTRVNWAINGERNFLLKIMYIIMSMEKKLGDDLQTGLKNLKVVLEKE